MEPDTNTAIADRVTEQGVLFDLGGREFNVMWVDEKQPLFVANNPLHWKAHKLQIMVQRMEKQAERNPAQFNSRNFLDALNELEKCMRTIKDQADEEILDESRLAGERTGSEKAAEMGDRAPAGVDSGVSADNPFSK